jgi:decaprenylphospho-beta-D-erythro-pentofuranosid-2-ulose 2-reductase
LNKETVLLMGARSDIALALAHRFAKVGNDIQLAARNSDGLIEDKLDIELRYGVNVTLHEFDALDTTLNELFINSLPMIPDVAVCVIGHMGEQKASERDVQIAALVMRSNYEGPAAILAALANRFEERGSGTLVGISSVAGERGRATNYVYGSAKAGLTAFLSGLRNRLSKKNVHVITVLSGFVYTKMTENMELPVKLTAQPSEVANSVFRAVQKKRNIVYVKPIWQLIMIIIRNIPETIFKRTNI